MGVQLFAGLVISASTARPCDKTLFSELRGDGPTAMGAFYGYAWGSSGLERCESTTQASAIQPLKPNQKQIPISAAIIS